MGGFGVRASFKPEDIPSPREHQQPFSSQQAFFLALKIYLHPPEGMLEGNVFLAFWAKNGQKWVWAGLGCWQHNQGTDLIG